MPENHKLDVGFVQANFRDLVLPMGLKVNTVKVSGEGLHLETEPFMASMAVPGSFEVSVGDASLAEFLNLKSPGGLRNFAVSSRPGVMEVRASVVMLIELRAVAECTLRIVDGRFLYVDLQSVSVMGAGATSLVQSQLDKLNPILDVEEFPVRATLDRVELVDGGVLLLGTVAPPESR